MIRLNADFQELVASWGQIAASGQFTEGAFVKELETALEKHHGQHAVACNSCGSGLFMLGLALGKQTAVIPNNTFYATGAMMKEAGWDLILADCAEDDFSLTPETILEAAYASGKKVTAVVLTHVGGGLAKRYTEIAALCNRHGWLLIEDAAHALGTTSAGLTAGSSGRAASFSFYPTKAIPAGDGGAVVTRDARLADELRKLRNYGKHKVDGVIRYGRGFNLRMDEWTAAVAWHQFNRLEQILEARHRSARKLSLVVPPLVDWGGDTNWYKFIADASFPAKRQAGKVYQRSDQLGTIWGQDPVTAVGLDGMLTTRPLFPVSARIAESHICLPLDETVYDGMTPGEIEAWLLGGGA